MYPHEMVNIVKSYGINYICMLLNILCHRGNLEGAKELVAVFQLGSDDVQTEANFIFNTSVMQNRMDITKFVIETFPACFQSFSARLDAYNAFRNYYNRKDKQNMLYIKQTFNLDVSFETLFIAACKKNNVDCMCFISSNFIIDDRTLREAKKIVSSKKHVQALTFLNTYFK